MVGEVVGGAKNVLVGTIVGGCIGELDGGLDGLSVCRSVGKTESEIDGDIETYVVGVRLRDSDGAFVGTIDDNTEGTSVGALTKW